MKKQYTKKQITEAIAYWKKQLKKMNESFSKYDHTDPNTGIYPTDTSPYGSCLTWGEFKDIVDKSMSDDKEFNIALLVGPKEVGYGECACYVDVDAPTNTIVVSMAGN